MQASGAATGDASEEVPEDVISQAKAAFTRRSPGELAVLAWDSLLDEDEPARDHRLRFEHPDLQIEVRVFSGPGSSDLQGQVMPQSTDRVAILSQNGDVLDATDAINGGFAFAHVPAGTVRLSVRGSAGSEIHTDWFRV